jgi:hypothetical protein
MRSETCERPIGDRRRCARAPVGMEAQFRERGRGAFAIDIRNLSRDGCGARLHGPVVFGDHLWIRLPTLASLPARIAWTAAGEAGIQFEQPLHEAVAALLVARAAPAA